MMRTRVVLNRVLNELKSGKPDRIKRQVVRSAGVGKRQRLCSRIGKRRKPRFKKRTHRAVPLHINPADPSRTVIKIVVCGELVVLWALGKCLVFHLAEM